MKKRSKTPPTLVCIRPGQVYKKVGRSWKLTETGKTLCGSGRRDWLSFNWGGMAAVVVKVRGVQYAWQTKAGRVFLPGKKR